MYPLYWTTSKEGIADMLGYGKKTKNLRELMFCEFVVWKMRSHRESFLRREF